MRNGLNCLIILAMLISFAACGVANRLPQKKAATASPENADTPSVIYATAYSRIQTSLKKAYRKWEGTPYQWGGTTMNGIDCSAFTQILFNRYFEIEIPRTTKQQIYSGRKVNRRNLKPGDLIFFKTGRKTLHVGVIIDKPKFLHASTSQGVTVSSLENYYWRSRFLTAKRVLN